MRLQLSAKRPLSIDRQGFLTEPQAIDPRTAAITIRLTRPTSANPLVWPATSKLSVSIVVEIDGVIHRASGSVHGGIITDSRPGRGRELDTYSLQWNLPTGFFARGGEPASEWSKIRNRRIGETAKTFRAWVVIESDGPCESELEVISDVSPAPARAYHSSVAYQNGTSATEASGGDGQLSLSFDAGAGSNRAAFVFGSSTRDGVPTSASVTYDGSITTDLGDVTNTFQRGAGGIANDLLIGSGAKTIAFASGGGSGSFYFTFLGVVSFTGVNQGTPAGTVGTAGADTGTALSITVAAPAADSMVVDGWAWTQDLGAVPAAGANQTERVLGGDAASNFIVFSTQSGADGGVMSYTKGASDWEYVGMAIEIKADAGGGAPAPLNRLLTLGVGNIFIIGLEWLRRRKNKIRKAA